MSDKELSTSFSQQPVSAKKKAGNSLIFLADELPEKKGKQRGRSPWRDCAERLRECAAPRLRSKKLK